MKKIHYWITGIITLVISSKNIAQKREVYSFECGHYFRYENNHSPKLNQLYVTAYYNNTLLWEDKGFSAADASLFSLHKHDAYNVSTTGYYQNETQFLGRTFKDNNNKKRKGLLLNFNKNAEINWTGILNSTKRDSKFESVTHTSSGGSIACGTTGRNATYNNIALNDTSQKIEYGVIIQTNKKGDLVWQYVRPKSRIISVRVSGNDLYAYGYQVDKEKKALIPILLKFDKYRNLVWERLQIGDLASINDFGCNMDMIIDTEGNIITAYINNLGSGKNTFVLAKYDTTGHLLWEKNEFEKNKKGTWTFRSLSSLKDNTILTTLTLRSFELQLNNNTYTQKTNESTSIISGFNSEGTPLFHKHYKGRKKKDLMVVNNFIQHNDSIGILGCYIGKIKTDQKTFEPQKVIGDAAGFTYWFDPKSLKKDCGLLYREKDAIVTHIPIENLEITDIQTTKIQVQANFIETETSFSIQLFDSYGELLKTTNYHSTTTNVHAIEFETGDIATGLYILHLYVDGATYNMKFVK